ncbi:ABC transporter substrate-binding protein [Paracoccus sp. IB05]|uniref:ABC transporter substrate-binding protein n=1 Tax=Paracoccus sp. IB05 TaxID=2779367 RepID=UPI0018E84107|nr:ABC transporter substrate-binding protein [Paracoccus sp. IB05]MBJ2150198.1 ABC transporter substrate-binding protein [Paracoccus sp. IB05]
MRDISIRLLWHKQAQFAGYLLAEELGLAEKNGVRIRCQGLDFACKHVNAIFEGQADMAVASPAHLLESRDPAALRWLLSIQQQSPLVYPARKSDGIATLADLAGRRAGVWPGHEDLELRWMLHRAGVADDAVTRIPMPDTVAPFLAGETATGQMTSYHELHVVEETIPHDELVIFDGRASGTQILKDGLIVPASLVEAEPEIVQAVVDAVLEGWTIAFDDPERAIAACLRARPERSHAEESAQLAAIRALSLTGATLTEGLGFPDPAHMEAAARAMREVEGAAPDTAGLRDPRFWQAAPTVFRSASWAEGAA